MNEGRSILVAVCLKKNYGGWRRRRRGGPAPVPPDRTPPAFAQCISNIKVTAKSKTNVASARWNEGSVKASDPCGIERIWRNSGPAPGSFFSEGSTRIYFSAKDRCGNTNTNGCSFVVTVSVVRCGTLPTQHNGRLTCDYQNYYGSRCTCSCNAGYYLTGSAERDCQNNGQWNGTAASCNIVSCPALPEVLNAAVSCSRDYLYQSVCTYFCQNNYTIMAGQSATRTCSASGSWTGVVPTCVDKHAPVLTCSTAFSVQTSSNLKTTARWNRPTATDNSGKAVSIDQTAGPEFGSQLEAGIYTVVYEGTDSSGNVGECSFTVTVRDVYCPEIQSDRLLMVNCSDGSRTGSTCDFTCASGYGHDGQSNATCQHFESTLPPSGNCSSSSDRPKCNAVLCPSIQSDQIYAVNCSDEVSTGSNCTLTCVSGCKEDNLASIICQRFRFSPPPGNWSSDGPQCVDVLCPEIRSDRNLTVNCSNGVRTGSNCTFTFAPRSKHDDLPSTTNERFPSPPFGSWDSDRPQCKLIMCPALSAPVNGRIVPSGQQSCPTVYGSWCHFLCNVGYELVGSSSRHCLALAGDTEGYWDGREAQCEPITCPTPYVPPHAKILNANHCSPRGNVRAGVTCQYGCEMGYILAGNSTLSCQADGSWDFSFPKCEVITCDNSELPTPDNGYKIGCLSLRETFGSVCTLGCHQGYMPTEGLRISCIDDGYGNGTWSDTTPTCEEVKCDPLEPPEHGYVEGCSLQNTATNKEELQSRNTICTSDCDYGFTGVGSNGRTCLMNGNWDGGRHFECKDLSAPVCDCPDDMVLFADVGRIVAFIDYSWEPLVCVDVSPPVVVNLQSINSDSVTGNRTSIFNEGSHTLLYGAVDQADNDATCSFELTIKITRCPSLYAPQNGLVTLTAGQGQCESSSVLGSVCSYECDEGYHLSTDEPKHDRKCESVSNFNTLGAWSSERPECIANRCNLVAPVNGFISVCDGSMVDFSTSCQFSCNLGYKSESGLQKVTRKCLADGEWSGADLVCQIVSCPGHSHLKHGVVSPADCVKATSLSYGTYCQFTCNSGFQQFGPFTKHCNANGLWSDTRNVSCVDKEAPHFEGSCPKYISSQTERASTVVIVSFTEPVANDNSGFSNVTRLGKFAPGDAFPEGSHTVPYTATDKAGNVARCDVHITVTVLRCKYLQAPASGSLANCPTRSYGSSCSFSCNTGYELEGVHTRWCEFSGSSVAWNGTQPICTPVQCLALEDDSFSILSGCLNRPPSTESFGTVCKWYCPYGYEGVGADESICQEGGSWSANDFSCQETSCSDLTLSDSITLTPSDCNVEANFKDACHLSCGTIGYRIDPPSHNYFRCQGDGSWSRNLETVKCIDYQPPHFTTCPLDFTIYSERGSYEGYVNWTVTASDNSGIAPQIKCSKSPGLFPEERYVIACRAEDGAENHADCTFEVTVKTRQCPPLKPPTFGNFIGNCMTYYGSTCKLTCVSGYQLVGSDTAICEKYETNKAMYWHRESYPVCKIPTCPSLDVELLPEFGGINPPFCVGVAALNYGSMCTFYCGTGFVLEGVSYPLTCQGDGTWTVDVQLLDVQCVAEEPDGCFDLPQPANGFLTCYQYHSGKYCTQFCDSQHDVPPNTDGYNGLFQCEWVKGSWAPPLVRDCSARKHPRKKQLPSTLHYVSGDCSDDATQANIEKSFKELLIGSDFFVENCEPPTTCTIDNIDIQCTSTLLRRRKRSATDLKTLSDKTVHRSQNFPGAIHQGTQENDEVTFWKKQMNRRRKEIVVQRHKRSDLDYQLDVYFDIVIDISNNGSLNDTEFEKASYAATNALYDIANEIELAVTAGNFKPSVDGLDIDNNDEYEYAFDYGYATPECDYGLVASQSSSDCVACPAGTYFTAVTAACVDCPQGQYTDQEAQSSCLACPEGSTTLQNGTNNSTLCVYLCEPGTWSHNGQTPCRNCSQRYYQPSSGQNGCIKCTGIFTTKGERSISPDECSVEITCENYSCLNGATCVSGNASLPICECVAGFTGEICETDIDDCVEYPCRNYGECVDAVNGFICNCAPGFTGLTCASEVVNMCESSPCKNNATCVAVEDSFMCDCLIGFEGDHCEEDIDECSVAPCQNGGTCVDFQAQYSCTCSHGFTGEQCEVNINECQSEPCLNGAKCIDQVGVFRCNCSEGYTGSYCDLKRNLCYSSPCVNGGSCIDVDDAVQCVCPKGYAGHHCEREATVCDDDPCQNGGICSLVQSQNGKILTDEYHCTCQPGLTGMHCESDINECTSQPCSNGGTCEDMQNCFVCHCPESFDGLQCEVFIRPCDLNPCENNGTCVEEGATSQCVCPLELEGERCENKVTVCRVDFCQNGGLCSSEGNEKICNCSAGFTGFACEQEVNECDSNPCLNDGVCSDKVNGYTCKCQSGYQGATCQDDINECASNPCLNGATCHEGPNSFLCECSEGYEGQRCESDFNDCDGVTCVHGTCRDGLSSYTCICDIGYRGRYCEENVDECASNPCAHKGTCMDEKDTFRCVCNSGWEGPLCEVNTDDCDDGLCQNGASCQDKLNNFTCVCLPGFTGRYCQKDVDDCASNPCVQWAICIDKVNGYTCKCPDIYAGYVCRTLRSLCYINPCEHGGTCQPSYSGFKCSCVDGFYGDSCQHNVDDCVDNTCHDGATCLDKVNDYVCLCPPSYTGEKCDQLLKPCDAIPCQNSGRCSVVDGKAVCACLSGYTGTYCEINIDDCDPNPCLHEGQCEDALNQYTCECATGYTGTICEENIDDCIDNKCHSLYSTRCQDGIGSYSCMCHHGFFGEFCDEAADVNFDLVFTGEVADQHISVDNIRATSDDDFTLALWLRSTSTKGLILSHSVEGYLTTQETLLTLSDPGQLKVYIKGAQFSSDVAVNDDLWHHVAVTHDAATSRVKLYIDGRFTVNKTFSSALHTEGKLLVVGVMEQQNNEGMIGRVNRLNLWTHTKTSGEVQELATQCNVPLPGDILGMADFLDGDVNDVRITKPSICDVDNECSNSPCADGATCIDGYHSFTCLCPQGLEGPNCSENVDDCWANLCENNGTCVDDVNDFSCICRSDFTGGLCDVEIVNGGWSDWSEWTNCTAPCDGGTKNRTRTCDNPEPQNGGNFCSSNATEVEECNTVPCPECTPFVSPKNGNFACEITDEGDQLCNMTCDSGFGFSRTPLVEYSCGPSTDFLWPNGIQAKPPACTHLTAPIKYQLSKAMLYPELECANMDTETVSSVNSKITQTATINVQQLDCIKNGSCEMNSISVFGCAVNGTKGGEESNVTVVMVIDKSINADTGVITSRDDYQNHESFQEAQSTLRTANGQMERKIKMGAFRVAANGDIYDVDEKSVGTYGDPVCKLGSVESDPLCIPCEAGAYHTEMYCVLCNEGSYQPEEGKTYCLPCPDGTSSEAGAASESNCT